ncbi:MAG: alpha/beta fold hydrolase [Burkholderiales bacterium]|nr:alpha/beta fold hydrolase [Burkholderiales bacterium]
MSQSSLGWVRSALAVAYRVAPVLTETWVAHQFLSPARHGWPAVERECLAGAEVGTLYTADLPEASWNFRPMRTYRWGKPTRGRIAVMHGWAGRATQFHRFIATFVDAGYEVIGIDAPGHGGSVGKISSLFHFLTALERLVRNAGPVDAVIGHSLGGGVALHALANGLKAKKAVLIAPNADLVLYSRVITRQLGLDETRRQSLQARIEARFGVRWEEVNGILRAASVTQPGLVIHDLEDREIPFSMAEAISEAWTGAQLMTTTGLGHRRILADEQVVGAALDYVRQ